MTLGSQPIRLLAKSRNCSPLDHRSLSSEFESRRWHIRRMFHLFDFGGRSAYLAYHVHKSKVRGGIKHLLSYLGDSAAGAISVSGLSMAQGFTSREARLHTVGVDRHSEF